MKLQASSFFFTSIYRPFEARINRLEAKVIMNNPHLAVATCNFACHYKSSVRIFRKLLIYYILIHHLASFVASHEVVAAVNEPSIYSMTDSGEPNHGDHQCQDNPKPDICNIGPKFNYTTLSPFNNTFGHNLEQASGELSMYYFLFQNPGCKARIQLFLCQLYLPLCVDFPDDKIKRKSGLLLPCREECERSMSDVCMDILTKSKMERPKLWDCENFPYHKDDLMCVIDNSRSPSGTLSPHSSSSSSSSYPSTNKNNPHNEFKTEEESLGPLDSLGHHEHQVDPQASSSSDSGGTTPPPIQTTTSSPMLCENGLFDCKLQDSAKTLMAICIEPEMVCDGKIDCMINGSHANPSDGWDEHDCDSKCHDGFKFCDGNCFSPDKWCNGEYDCSDLRDEKDCIEVRGPPAFVYLLAGMAMFLVTILSYSYFQYRVKKLREAEKDEPKIIHQPYPGLIHSLDTTPHNLPIASQYDHIGPSHMQPGICVHMDATDMTPDCGESNVYQAVYSDASYRGDYDFINQGARTGSSSIYDDHAPFQSDYGTNYHPILEPTRIESKESPPPPPPTPVTQFHAYSNMT